MIKFQLVKAQETFDLRHRILRPHQPLAESQYSGDNDEVNFHLGALDGDKIICVASFFREPHKYFGEAGQYRLRGMATDENYRRKGLGSQLIKMAIPILRERGCERLWCNAREVAFSFYEGLGFEMSGDFFELPGIGLHKVMHLKLGP